jgi:hypothetical protein
MICGNCRGSDARVAGKDITGLLLPSHNLCGITSVYGEDEYRVFRQ